MTGLRGVPHDFAMRDDAVAAAEGHLARGDLALALMALLPALEARDDGLCGVAARLLRAQDEAAAAPDALALALDRLIRLVERQEAQIAALRALLDERL